MDYVFLMNFWAKGRPCARPTSCSCGRTCERAIAAPVAGISPDSGTGACLVSVPCLPRQTCRGRRSPRDKPAYHG